MGLAVKIVTLCSAGEVEMIDIIPGGDIQEGTIDVDTTSGLHKKERQLTSAAILPNCFGMVEIMWNREVTDLARCIHVTMFTVVDIFGEMGFDVAGWWGFAYVLYFKDPLFEYLGYIWAMVYDSKYLYPRKKDGRFSIFLHSCNIKKAAQYIANERMWACILIFRILKITQACSKHSTISVKSV
jgi:hypothetical protein